MGCAAYRCAHNPPAPELLAACDRLGMLVMDENRRFDNTPEVLAPLAGMIRRDRNHPSVFIWSLANEEMDLQKNVGGNGNPNTTESDKLPRRKVFNGLALVIEQSTENAGEINLTATASGLKTETTTIKSARCACRPALASVN